jgi:hypothetical protein
MRLSFPNPASRLSCQFKSFAGRGLTAASDERILGREWLLSRREGPRSTAAPAMSPLAFRQLCQIARLPTLSGSSASKSSDPTLGERGSSNDGRLIGSGRDSINCIKIDCQAERSTHTPREKHSLAQPIMRTVCNPKSGGTARIIKRGGNLFAACDLFDDFG